jgi:hypothetical protein
MTTFNFRIAHKALAFIFCAIAYFTFSFQALAITTYLCPSPDQIRCIPTVSFLGGWQHNGGQMTGNTFAPNNQCANVITLGPTQQRLLCCYDKCGVFYRDVRSKQCVKQNQFTFQCRPMGPFDRFSDSEIVNE